MFCPRAATNKLRTAVSLGLFPSRYKSVSLFPGSKSFGIERVFRPSLLTATQECHNLLRVRSLPCHRRSFTPERRLSTTHWLSKKDGEKPVGRLPPGDTSKSSSSPGNEDQKPIVFSPATVQVFADPTMAQTVRDVSVDIQKLKGQLQFMKEEFSDTSFEVLKLSQGRASIIAALKESRNLSRDNQAAITSLKTEQKKLDQLLVYISKMVARHENQLNDTKNNSNTIKKIEHLSQRVDQCNVGVGQLKTALHNQLQVDLKKAATDVKKLQNDVSRIELEVKYRGREIADLKSKSHIALSDLDKQQKKT